MMPSLCFLLICFLFGQIETFIVSPEEHIDAEIGKHVTLKCMFNGNGDSNPAVIWQKIGVDQTVHKYSRNENDFSNQHKNYTKRTELHGVNKGDASLTLKHVNMWDEGTYKCVVYDDNGFGEASIQLSVWAQSTDGLHITWKSNGNGNDMLSCQSSGWYPEPEVSWKDNHGNDLSAFSVITTTETTMDFSVLNTT